MLQTFCNLLPFLTASLIAYFMLCFVGNLCSPFRRTKYRNGFTLVELLVVIAIIGMLSNCLFYFGNISVKYFTSQRDVSNVAVGIAL